MTKPPIVRITTIVVAAGVFAIAVFAAFYILGAIAAVIACAALGVALIALVAFASSKLGHYRDRKAVGGPLAPAQAPVADPPA